MVASTPTPIPDPEPPPELAQRICTYSLSPEGAVDAGWPVFGAGPSGPWAASVRAQGRVSGEIVVARQGDNAAVWARIGHGDSRAEGWVHPESLRLAPTRAIALSDTIYLVGRARLKLVGGGDDGLTMEIEPPERMSAGGPLRAEVPCPWLTPAAHASLSPDLDVPRPPLGQRLFRPGSRVDFRAEPGSEPTTTLVIASREDGEAVDVADIIEVGRTHTRVMVRSWEWGLAVVGWVDNATLGESFAGGLGLVGTGGGRQNDHPHVVSCVQPVDIIAEAGGKVWRLGTIGASQAVRVDNPDLASASVQSEWLRPAENARLRIAAPRDAGCGPHS